MTAQMGKIKRAAGGEPASAPVAKRQRAEKSATPAGSAELETSGKYDVFVSHAGEQKRGVVGFLVEELKRADRNLNVFVDYEMAAGTNATALMVETARRAPVGVFVLSKDFFKKDWPLKEANIFLERARASPPQAHIVSYFYGVKPGKKVPGLTSAQQAVLDELSKFSGHEHHAGVDFEHADVKAIADAVGRLVPPSTVGMLRERRSLLLY